MNDVLPLRSAAELRADVAGRVVRYRRRRRQAVAAFAAPVVVIATLAGAFGLTERLTSQSVQTGVADDGAITTDETEHEVHDGTQPGSWPGTDESTNPAPAPQPQQGGTPGARAGATPTSLPRAPRADAPALLAFVRNGELHVQRSDGTGLRRIDTGAATTPAWAPGGDVLAFSEPRPQGGHRLTTVDLRSNQRRVVAEEPDASLTDPAWSPDGTRIAVSRRPRVEAPGGASSIWTVDAAGGALRRVADGARPSWSPDGRLVFDCGTGLCTSDADGSRQAPVPGSDGLWDAAWSPDGTWLAAVDGGLRLVVVRPDGSGRRVVAEGVRAGPAWFPEGNRLAFPAKAAVGVRGIWSIDVVGNERRQLTTEAGDDGPSLASD